MKKQEVITFKADQELAKMLKSMPNRSEFIRTAILSAAKCTCPLCGGSGTLTLAQRRHWLEFQTNHSLEFCSECETLHLTCEADNE